MPRSEYKNKFFKNYSLIPTRLLMASIVLSFAQYLHSLIQALQYNDYVNFTIVSVMSIGVTILSYLANEVIFANTIMKLTLIKNIKKKLISIGKLIKILSGCFITFLSVYFLTFAYEKNFETFVYFKTAGIIYYIGVMLFLFLLFLLYFLKYIILKKLKGNT